ncbi:hypothetical protein Q1695_006568 [Nippostrongylus brasiliensis]|nr:hypothetical protein Q1695_006568 [Nippostrongylus brasiliensis]
MGATHSNGRQQEPACRDRCRFARSLQIYPWQQRAIFTPYYRRRWVAQDHMQGSGAQDQEERRRKEEREEKWCLYVITKYRSEWVCPQNERHHVQKKLQPRETMLCIWWEYEGAIHYVLLKRDISVDAEIYVEQMDRLRSAIEQERSTRQHGIALLHDNAKPHTASITLNVTQANG